VRFAFLSFVAMRLAVCLSPTVALGDGQSQLTQVVDFLDISRYFHPISLTALAA
jgi:hypothetical protein